MKKVLFLIVFLFITLSTTMINAQTPGLSIQLLDALSFSINQPENLDLEYVNTGKFKDRILAKIPDHITVVSSRGYVVKAVSGANTGKESNLVLPRVLVNQIKVIPPDLCLEVVSNCDQLTQVQQQLFLPQIHPGME
jgi:hypothetical protein